MKNDRKLRLVRADEGVMDHERTHLSAIEDEATVTDAERAEAEALRVALEQGAHPLALVLRAASAPASIDGALHDAMIEEALGARGARDDDEAPTNEERAAATELRDALRAPRGERPDAPLVELADALHAAHRPRDIEPLRNEALIARALGRSSGLRRRGRVIPVVTAAIVMAAAAAASFALFVRPSGDASVAEAPELQRSRSAGELFDTPFPRVGGESARVDRIASARAAELRQNRFALWGVR